MCVPLAKTQCKTEKYKRRKTSVTQETAYYLHHVIQTVEDVLPSLLGLNAHLHFMLCWCLENIN